MGRGAHAESPRPAAAEEISSLVGLKEGTDGGGDDVSARTGAL
jgi:hypothetical protein